MPEQTNDKRAALLEELASLARLSRQLARPGGPEVERAAAVKAILAYFNDPEITMAFNEIKRWYA